LTGALVPTSSAGLSGQATKITIKSNANTTFTLPFVISRTMTTPVASGSFTETIVSDPALAALGTSCGLIGSGERPPIKIVCVSPPLFDVFFLFFCFHL
jgi:hypothetical protein